MARRRAKKQKNSKPPQVIFVCLETDCGQIFRSKTAFTDHKHSHLSQECSNADEVQEEPSSHLDKDDNVTYTYICLHSGCGEQFDNKLKYDLHQSIHVPAQTSACKQALVNETDLDRHHCDGMNDEGITDAIDVEPENNGETIVSNPERQLPEIKQETEEVEIEEECEEIEVKQEYEGHFGISCESGSDVDCGQDGQSVVVNVVNGFGTDEEHTGVPHKKEWKSFQKCAYDHDDGAVVLNSHRFNSFNTTMDIETHDESPCSKNQQLSSTDSPFSSLLSDHRTLPMDSVIVESPKMDTPGVINVTLARHTSVQSDHPIAMTSATPTFFHCTFCPTVFKHRRSMTRHLQRFHSDTTCTLRCSVCQEVVWCQRHLKRHERLHALEKSNKEILKCSVCRSWFSDKRSLSRHKKSHASITCIFKCQICSKTFKSRDSMRRHEKKSHSLVS